MRLSEMGLVPLPLGQWVHCTHRAARVKGGFVEDINPRARAVVYELFRDPATRVLTAPLRPRHVGQPPEPLTNWVVAWPAERVGLVVGLTYRSEGFHEAPRISDDGDVPWLRETERHPFYVVKETLNGVPAVVPPWAVYPGAGTYTGPLASLDGEPVLHAGVAFADYAESLTMLTTTTKEK